MITETTARAHSEQEARVRDLLDRYDTADACAALLLCDGHRAEAVAFTVVERT